MSCGSVEGAKSYVEFRYGGSRYIIHVCEIQRCQERRSKYHLSPSGQVRSSADIVKDIKIIITFGILQRTRSKMKNKKPMIIQHSLTHLRNVNNYNTIGYVSRVRQAYGNPAQLLVLIGFRAEEQLDGTTMLRRILSRPLMNLPISHTFQTPGQRALTVKTLSHSLQT